MKRNKSQRFGSLVERLNGSERPGAARRANPAPLPCVEALQDRVLFNATPAGYYTPQQIRHAYGVDKIQFNGVVGDGSGQTIAIISQGSDPDALFDLQQFDKQFGLPNPPAFSRVDEHGGKSFPPVVGAGEESLDIQWAHALAPKAKILVVECGFSSVDLEQYGVQTAKNTPGVVAVSLSYDGQKTSGSGAAEDADFTTPAGHGGVTFINSSGDSGWDGGSVNYPAASPNVVAVGGTDLNANGDGTYVSEDGWVDSGGGISKFTPQPAYQRGVVSKYSTTARTVPDLSLNAGPGVAVYDSHDYGTASPWTGGGGTSLAAPLFAGLIAVADQGRALDGLASLDGRTQTLPRIYSAPAADYHDITVGNNKGYSAGPGYDLVTGRGSPRADLLVPYLAFGFDTSSFTVTNTNDAGIGSLRQAIINENLTGSAVPITFRIPKTDHNYQNGVFNIHELSSMPTLLRANVLIDGSTQEAFTGNTNGGRPVVFLDGTSAKPFTTGLTLSGSQQTIKSLGITHFSTGISISGVGAVSDQVIGSLVGVGPTGVTAAANVIGIEVSDGASGAMIGSSIAAADANVISGNTSEGVLLYGSSNDRVDNNLIGVNGTTQAALPNGIGVEILGVKSFAISSGNAIINNVISGNKGDGVQIDGTGAQGNSVRANKIGVTGTGAVIGYNQVANGAAGIHLLGGATGNTLGGTGSEGNLIAGNAASGIDIDGANNNVVIGNKIGVATHLVVGGKLPTSINLGNGGSGLMLHNGATGNAIGSAVSGQGNVISGNTLAGIALGSPGNTVSGNLIGTNSGGGSTPNRREGIYITAANNKIIGNTIAFNGLTGVTIVGAWATGNSILGDSIYDNTGLGIDLGGDGVTPNDAGDADAGPNSLLNAPVLYSAIYSPQGWQVTLSFNGEPNSHYMAQFYSSISTDATGYGEGQINQGTVYFNTDSGGNLTFTTPLNSPTGPYVTATITDMSNNTSEFSNAIRTGTPAHYVQTVLGTAGLVAYWRFDNATGGTTSSIVNGFAGTLVGHAALSAAGSGVPLAGDAGNQALSLDGNGSALTTNLGPQQSFDNAGTYLAWVKFGQTPAQAGRIFTILGKGQFGNDLDLQAEPDGKIHFYTDTGTSSSYKPDSLTGWHLVAATFDEAAKQRRIYWDGKLVTDDAYAGIHKPSTNAFSIGQSLVFPNRYFSGSIDEVSLFNRALTPQQISAIYAAAH